MSVSGCHKDGAEPPVGGSCFDQGRDDFVNNKTYGSCPYKTPENIRSWRNGWMREKEDLDYHRRLFVMGFSGRDEEDGA